MASVFWDADGLYYGRLSSEWVNSYWSIEGITTWATFRKTKHHDKLCNSVLFLQDNASVYTSVIML